MLSTFVNISMCREGKGERERGKVKNVGEWVS